MYAFVGLYVKETIGGVTDALFDRERICFSIVAWESGISGLSEISKKVVYAAFSLMDLKYCTLKKIRIQLAVTGTYEN